MLVPAFAIMVGDYVDLQGDSIADPHSDSVFFRSEYMQVASVDDEDSAIAIGFEGWDVCGFPPHHRLEVFRRQDQETGDEVKPAYMPAVPREPDRVQRLLAESLACYVSGDDLVLDRRAFIATVASRIRDDLEQGTE